MNLNFVKNTEIDYGKWNRLVERYSEGLPYAYSWYLDSVCHEWYAYIWGDYKAAFPFQINHKWGLSYSLHPFLTQQLGFLGKDEDVFEEILKKIQSRVFFYHYQLFFFNVNNHPEAEIRSNYELNLENTYEEIRKSFNSNTKRNIKKADAYRYKIIISNDLKSDDENFIIENSVIELDNLQQLKFKALMANAKKNNALLVYKTEFEEQTTAINVYILSKTRAVYLLSVQNDKGKEIKSNFSLVNQFIKDNAGNKIILDFEGSNVEGVARFYKGFGAYKTSYQAIKKTSFKKSLNKINLPIVQS